jgi:hypothetical protein
MNEIKNKYLRYFKYHIIRYNDNESAYLHRLETHIVKIKKVYQRELKHATRKRFDHAII